MVRLRTTDIDWFELFVSDCMFEWINETGDWRKRYSIDDDELLVAKVGKVALTQW